MSNPPLSGQLPPIHLKKASWWGLDDRARLSVGLAAQNGYATLMTAKVKQALNPEQRAAEPWISYRNPRRNKEVVPMSSSKRTQGRSMNMRQLCAGAASFR